MIVKNFKSDFIVEELSYLSELADGLLLKDKKLAIRVMMLYELKMHPEITMLSLSNELSVNRRTLTRWWKEYLEGGLNNLIGLDQLSLEATNFVRNWVKRGDFLRYKIKDLVADIEFTFGEIYTLDTVNFSVEKIKKELKGKLNLTEEEFLKKLEKDENKRKIVFNETLRNTINNEGEKLLKSLEDDRKV